MEPWSPNSHRKNGEGALSPSESPCPVDRDDGSRDSVFDPERIFALMDESWGGRTLTGRWEAQEHLHRQRVLPRGELVSGNLPDVHAGSMF